MFYKRGEEISDQFEHFKKKLTFGGKMGIVGFFIQKEGGGSSISTSLFQCSTKNGKFCVKTKNIPYVLKYKI